MSKHTRDGIGAGVGDLLPGTITPVGANKTSDGTLQSLQLDDSGNLKVTSTGGGGGGAATIADGADVAEGSTGDAAWSGVGSGTVVSILKKLATSGTGGGPATIADGADVAEGATTDVAVQGDNAGTISAKLRGLNKSIAAGLSVLISDAGTFGPTTMSSGSGDVTIQTPGPGVLTVHIAVSGVTGNLGLTEQFTSGGSFFSGVGGYITAAPFINNPVQNYLKLNETVGLTTATNFVVVLHARGIAIKLINNITVGSISVEGTFKANATALHPIVLVGNAGQSSGFAADVSSHNELLTSRVGDNQQLTTGVPNTDGQSFPGSRTTPIDGAIGYLYNGTTWDRPRGDSTNGAFVNVKASTRLGVDLEYIGLGGAKLEQFAVPLQLDNITPPSVGQGGPIVGAVPLLVNPGGGYDRAPGDITNGAIVQGSDTPIDFHPNPTNAVPAESFLMGWDSGFSAWIRLRCDDNGVLKVAPQATGTIDQVEPGPDVVSAAFLLNTVGGTGPIPALALSGRNSCAVTVNSNGITSFIGSIGVQVSSDSGLTWNNTYFIDYATRAVSPSFAITAANEIIVTNLAVLLPGGATHVRVICLSISNVGGGLILKMSAVSQPNIQVPAIASDAAPTLTAGPSFLSTDLTGNLRVTGKVTIPDTTTNDLSMLQLLTQVVAELRAIHLQLSDMSGHYVETAPFLDTNTTIN